MKRSTLVCLLLVLIVTAIAVAWSRSDIELAGGKRNEGKRGLDQSAIHSSLLVDPKYVLDGAVREWSHSETNAIPAGAKDSYGSNAKR